MQPSGPRRRSRAVDIRVLALDLPEPPSVNAIPKRLGNASAEVRDWIRRADAALMVQHIKPLRAAIHGPFAIHITWIHDRWTHFDIDNRVKPLLDWLQRVELIDNDKLCRRMTVDWGYAPQGCRVLLWEV